MEGQRRWKTEKMMAHYLKKTNPHTVHTWKKKKCIFERHIYLFDALMVSKVFLDDMQGLFIFF